MALEHRPALVVNLIPFTPRGCFSDVTGAHNITPWIFKEVILCPHQLARWEAKGKPIRIAYKPIPIDPALAPHGHVVWIESLAPRKENGKAFEKQHALFMPRKIFEGTHVSGDEANQEWRAIALGGERSRLWSFPAATAGEVALKDIASLRPLSGL
jgi:hypothetical protein